jgi:hypothetical protein
MLHFFGLVRRLVNRGVVSGQAGLLLIYGALIALKVLLGFVLR